MKIDETMVMVLPQKLVEQVPLGLYDPINEHLVKLVGFDFPAELLQHFRRELKSWLRKIQRLRFKLSNRTGSAKFYFDLLFDYPFGGVEVENMQSMMDFIARRYPGVRASKTPEQMVEWLRVFHSGLAQRLSDRRPVLDMIPA